jgi:flagellar assembly protein FliH
MGRVIRGAAIARNSYIVTVPELGAEPAPEIPGDELDDRFATSQEDGVRETETPVDEPARVDIERVRADAEALIDTAAAQGEAILHDAAKRAREIVDGAVAQAAQIEAQAQTHGHAEGLAAGQAAVQAEAAEAIGKIQELVESVRAQRHLVLEGAEPEIVRLAMTIAERIVHQQIALDPNVIVESVRHALTRLANREMITLRVNPADLETIRKHREEFVNSNEIEHLRIIEDQRVDRGGVIVETEAGTIDAKIATQLRETRRVLQVAESIVQAS